MLGRLVKPLMGLASLLVAALPASAQSNYDCGDFLAIQANFALDFLTISLKQDLVPSYGLGRLPAGDYRINLDWSHEGYSLYSLNISRWVTLSNSRGKTYVSVAYDSSRGFETIDVTHYVGGRPPSSLFYKTLSCRQLGE